MTTEDVTRRNAEENLEILRKLSEEARAQGEAIMGFVVQARAGGATLREIGDAAGLSVEGVRKMIARAERVTVHHEPDPPELWVVYANGTRLAQFESQREALAHAARLRR